MPLFPFPSLLNLTYHLPCFSSALFQTPIPLFCIPVSDLLAETGEHSLNEVMGPVALRCSFWFRTPLYGDKSAQSSFLISVISWGTSHLYQGKWGERAPVDLDISIITTGKSTLATGRQGQVLKKGFLWIHVKFFAIITIITDQEKSEGREYNSPHGRAILFSFTCSHRDELTHS